MEEIYTKFGRPHKSLSDYGENHNHMCETHSTQAKDMDTNVVTSMGQEDTAIIGPNRLGMLHGGRNLQKANDQLGRGKNRPQVKEMVNDEFYRLSITLRRI